MYLLYFIFQKVPITNRLEKSESMATSDLTLFTFPIIQIHSFHGYIKLHITFITFPISQAMCNRVDSFVVTISMHDLSKE